MTNWNKLNNEQSSVTRIVMRCIKLAPQNTCIIKVSLEKSTGTLLRSFKEKTVWFDQVASVLHGEVLLKCLSTFFIFIFDKITRTVNLFLV